MAETGRILIGDVREQLRTLPDASVHCVVTSPPYWGLRDYGIGGQLGLEATPEEHVAAMVEVFREVKRVLRDDGTAWVNYGDSHWKGGGWKPDRGRTFLHGEKAGPRYGGLMQRKGAAAPGLRPKDLVGMPWRVAFGLQADGWYLRSDIIWHKPNPMPESCTDRPPKSHEPIFLLAKSRLYFYDAEAVREGVKTKSVQRCRAGFQGSDPARDAHHNYGEGFQRGEGYELTGRNLRDVWPVATFPYPGAHFATFPPDLIRPCSRAGCPAGGTVLDPFFGIGTTGLVCDQEGRDWLGIELNPEYAEIARRRLNEKQEALF